MKKGQKAGLSGANEALVIDVPLRVNGLADAIVARSRSIYCDDCNTALSEYEIRMGVAKHPACTKREETARALKEKSRFALRPTA